MEKFAKIGSNPYYDGTGRVSVKYNNHRVTHIPVIKVDGIDEVNKDNDISAYPQNLQDDINACFDFYGVIRFETEEKARRAKEIADNPVLPVPTVQEQFDAMDSKMKAGVKTIAQITNTPLQDAIDIFKSHMN